MIGSLPIQFASAGNFKFRPGLLADPEPELTDWLTAVVNNSGVVGEDAQYAMMYWIAAGKFNGWHAKLKFYNFFVGDWNASAVAIKHVNPNKLVTRTNFVTGDYSEATGYQSNGSKFVNLNFIPSSNGITTGNGALGVYSHTPDDGPWVDIGCSDGTSSNGWRIDCRSGGNANFISYFAGSFGQISRANTDGSGFIVGSRVATNDARIFRNGAQLGTTFTTTQSTVPAAQSLHVFVYRAANLLAYSSRRISLAFAASGLSEAKISKFYTDIQTLYTTIGRTL